jgi:hypothetical protein
VRVSVSSDDVEGNGGSSLPSISSHWAHIAFSSDASTLVPMDDNLQSDCFVRDLVR